MERTFISLGMGLTRWWKEGFMSAYEEKRLLGGLSSRNRFSKTVKNPDMISIITGYLTMENRFIKTRSWESACIL